MTDEPLWNVVQQHPSAAVFPGEEGLAQVQSRAVATVREHDKRVAAEHGNNAVWLLCSHGDVIKSALADALGMHLDGSLRLVVEPCSVSVVRYTDTRPSVVRPGAAFGFVLQGRAIPAAVLGGGFVAGLEELQQRPFRISANPSRVAPDLLPTRGQSSPTNVHRSTSSSGSHI